MALFNKFISPKVMDEVHILTFFNDSEVCVISFEKHWQVFQHFQK